MAKFNPDTPEVNPQSYLQYARPISEYQGDMTGGTVLKGIGDVFKNVVTGVDEYFKDTINKGLRKDLTEERDATTGALEQIAGVPADQRVSPYQPTIPSSVTGNSPSDIIPGSVAEPVPSQFQSIDKQVAGANTGALTKPAMGTYYTGKLDVIAKDYRAQYPGYADYIDERIQAITGMNPANKRVEDLMALIQQSGHQQLQELEKAKTHLLTTQFPGADAVMKRISTPGTPESKDPMGAVASFEAPFRKTEYDIKLAKEKNEKFIGDNSVKVIETRQAMSPILDDINNTMFKNTIDSMNMTVGDLENAAYDHITKKKVLTPESADAAAQAISIVGQNVRRQMEQAMIKSGASATLPDGGQAMINEKTAKYEQLAKMFSDKDTGPAHEYARQIALSLDKSTNWLTKYDPNAWFYRLYMGAAKTGGPAVSGMLSTFSLGTTMVDQTISAYKKFSTLQLANPWDQNGNTTLEGIIDHMRESSQPNSTDGKAVQGKLAESYKYFTSDLPAYIADPKFAAPMRATLAENIFNGNIVNKFADDYTDDKGFHPGKHTVLSTMTTDSIKDSVWNLANQNAQHPLWLQYKNWVASQTRDLVQGDIKTLDNITTNNQKIKFTYDDKTQQFGFVNTDPNTGSAWLGLWPQDPARRAREAILPETIAKINAAMKPSLDIVRKEGGDPNAFMLQKMQDLGLDPRKVSPAGNLMKTLIPEQKKSEIQGQPSLFDKAVSYVKKSSETPIGVDTALSKIRSGINDATTQLENYTKRSTEGLNSQFKTGLEQAIGDYKTETGNSVKIDDLMRSREEQAQAYARFLGGKGGLAAPPGHSRHEVGEAADINHDPQFLSWMKKQDMEKYNLEFLSGRYGQIDPGHIQLRRNKTATK